MSRIVDTAVKEGSFYTAVAFGVVLAAFPFYWMLITAFKTNTDLYNIGYIPFWFSEPPTLDHFRYLFDQALFARRLLNPLIIGVCRRHHTGHPDPRRICADASRWPQR